MLCIVNNNDYIGENMAGMTEYFVNQSVKAHSVPSDEAIDAIKADALKHEAWIILDGKRVLPENLTQVMIDKEPFIELIAQVVGG
jgi:hypothetical protein